MGSYAELSVAGYSLLSSKSMVIPQAMTIFRETDKRAFADRNPLVCGELDSPDDDEPETSIRYVCSTGKIIDRLNVMGFNLRRVREEFESLRRSEIEKLASWEDDSDWISKDMKFLEVLTFDDYTEGLRQVIARGLPRWPLYKPSGDSPIVEYILSENDDYFLGFFGSDVRSLLRLACEVVNIDSEVVQDITELVSAGYYGQDEAVCSNSIKALTSDYAENSPRIVLAEGSTDTAILREALDLLYPHLSGYYSFFDFDSSRSQGGAGHLVSIVKAFAAAGVSNRVVALFDNDTAAREARRTLDAISLPPSIAVLHYPAIEKLRSYPTIGPTGPTRFDINGLAASIELYLGEDVLAENGTFTPIQWKGFSESLGRYQGEVMHKVELRSAFWRKVQRCKSEADAMKAADWSGLEAILKAIFTAFD